MITDAKSEWISLSALEERMKRNIGFGSEPYTSPIDLTRRREASHGEESIMSEVSLEMQLEDLSVPADFISGEG